MPRKRTDYRSQVGQDGSEIHVIPGVSHRLVRIGSSWAHTRYQDRVLTLRESLTPDEAEALLAASRAQGDSIQGPAKPEWDIPVFIIRENS